MVYQINDAGALIHKVMIFGIQMRLEETVRHNETWLQWEFEHANVGYDKPIACCIEYIEKVNDTELRVILEKLCR